MEKPEAVAGNLCVFARKALNATTWSLGDNARFSDPQAARAEAAGNVGTGLIFASAAAGLVLANGTWAVTAE